MSSSTTRDTILSHHHQLDSTTTTDNSISMNDHPPQTTIYDRNGIKFNRGLSFLRNALFGHGITTSKMNNGGTCDAKDYKILNHSINSQSDQYVHPLQKIWKVKKGRKNMRGINYLSKKSVTYVIQTKTSKQTKEKRKYENKMESRGGGRGGLGIKKRICGEVKTLVR